MSYMRSKQYLAYVKGCQWDAKGYSITIGSNFYAFVGLNQILNAT